LFLPYFKSFSIEKIAIFRLGISTIQIPTHLDKHYQYFTRLIHWNVWRNVPLFWKFASDIVTYDIQIDFKWRTCYTPPGNKDHIDRNSIGWELITISSYDSFERLRIWIVRFQLFHLALFLQLLESILNYKLVIYKEWIRTISISTKLVKN
jgi:hypothetical protein